MKRFAQLFVKFRQFDKCIASLRRFFPVLDRQRNILDLYKNIKLNGFLNDLKEKNLLLKVIAIWCLQLW